MSLKQGTIDWAIDIIGGIADEMAGFGSSIANSAGEGLEALSNAATGSSAFVAFQGIGLSILTCTFLIYLGESALKDRNDSDGLIKQIALLGLYGSVMANLDGILSALSTIIQGILYWLGTAAVSFNQNANWSVDMESAFGDLQELNLIAIVFSVGMFAVIGNLAMLIVKGIAYVSIYTAKMELFARTILFPIAVGFIAEDGWKGPAGRYIKKWCACYLQLGIISVVLQSYVFVMTLCMGAQQGSELVSIIAGGFAAAGLCMKAGQLSNDALGV